MTLSVSQMAAMSRLLDEALPLDEDGRQAWLLKLPVEHHELAKYLHEALLSETEASGELAPLSTAAMTVLAGFAQAKSVLQRGVRVGPYELLRALGAGGMAEVWLARRADGAFKRDVALKLPILNHLHGALAERFARERDILASLEHPHIARFYDAGVDPGGLPYLSMEYVQGSPITEWCDTHRLGVSERVQLLLQVLEAVQYAHGKQIIHRDLKPSNILVTESGQVHLLDFGVAKLLEAAASELAPLTRIYGRALTPDYASPELMRAGPIDVRSDVYSIGVLLYELLTGARPYQLSGAASLGSLEQAIVAVEVKPPSTITIKTPANSGDAAPRKWTRELRGDLDAIVLKSLASDPTHRYASAASLADDLRRFLDGRPIGALPPSLKDRLLKFVRRNKPTVALSVAAAVSILALGTFIWISRLSNGALPQDPLANAKILRLTDFGTEQGVAISRDGRYVAFLADRNGHIDAWVTEVGSNRFRNLTEGQALQLANSSVRTMGFSPDGSLVTIWTRTADGSGAEDVKILAAPLDGGPLKPYLQDAAEYDWTRDGSQVVFHTTGPGDPLFVRTAAEGTARQIYIAPAGVHCHFPIWSPDNQFIYFVRGIPPSNWDIWRMRSSGADLERVTFHDTRVSYPVLLDAHTLMYLATDADGSGPWPYVMDLPRKQERRISLGLERYTSIAASANGSRLVATLAASRSDIWHVSVSQKVAANSDALPMEPAIRNAYAPRFGSNYMVYVSTEGGRHTIWKFTQGKMTKLWGGTDAGVVGAPAIAPDDSRVAFSVEDQNGKNLYVIDSNGQNPHIIATAVELRGNVAWYPDSKSLVAGILRDGAPRLTRIFTDGRPLEPLVSEYSIDPSWAPDGRYMVYSGADVGTTFPLRAAGGDGRPFSMASLILTRGARRVAFAKNSGSLVILRGEVDHKNFWLVDPQTGANHQLTDLPSNSAIGDFDVSPDGSQIIFARIEDTSNIALIERPAR